MVDTSDKLTKCADQFGQIEWVSLSSTKVKKIYIYDKEQAIMGHLMKILSSYKS